MQNDQIQIWIIIELWNEIHIYIYIERERECEREMII